MRFGFWRDATITESQVEPKTPGCTSLAASPTATLTRSSDVTEATTAQRRAPTSSSATRSSRRPTTGQCDAGSRIQRSQDARSEVTRGQRAPLRWCCLAVRTTRAVPCRGPAHRLSIGIVGLGCALAIAACGASGAPGARAPAQNQALAYVPCIRSHGITSGASRTYRTTSTPRLRRSGPHGRRARRACRGQRSSSRVAELDAAVTGRGAVNARARTADVPDPMTSLPPAPAPGSQDGNVIGGPGAYLVLPPPSPALS